MFRNSLLIALSLFIFAPCASAAKPSFISCIRNNIASFFGKDTQSAQQRAVKYALRDVQVDDVLEFTSASSGNTYKNLKVVGSFTRNAEGEFLPCVDEYGIDVRLFTHRADPTSIQFYRPQNLIPHNRLPTEVVPIFSAYAKNAKFYGADLPSFVKDLQKAKMEFSELTLIGDVKYFASQPILIHEERSGFILIIEKGDQRTFIPVYRSNSSGEFRVLNAVQRNSYGDVTWYSKYIGTTHQFGEDALNVPIDVKLALSKRLSNSKPVENAAQKDLFFSATANNSLGVNTAIDESLFSSRSLLPGATPSKKYDSGNGSHFLAPEELGKMAAVDRPNFANTLRTYTETLPQYGNVEVSVYQSNSGLTFYFNRTQDNKIWISAVEDASAPIDMQLGIRSHFITSGPQGELTMPLTEYGLQIPNVSRVDSSIRATNKLESAWNYIRENPIIKEWYATEGKRLGITMPGRDMALPYRGSWNFPVHTNTHIYATRLTLLDFH